MIKQVKSALNEGQPFKLFKSEASKHLKTSTVLYCTVLYCTVLYCTVLLTLRAILHLPVLSAFMKSTKSGQEKGARRVSCWSWIVRN